MEEKHILTTRELAEYIRLNEKTDAEEITDTQWKAGLVSSDHHLQRRLLESPDEDLDLVIRSNNHPIPLSRMLDETLIDLDFYAADKNKALSNLAKIASMARIVSSYEELYLELKEREAILSTATGGGVAIPHSRFPCRMIYKQPRLIIARSAAGVDFGAPDHKRVHLFFMPCAPSQFSHLRLMAQIAKFLHSPGVIPELRGAEKKQDILKMIRAFEER